MPLDLEDLAMQVALRIYSVLGGKNEKVKADAFVRRAKELPSIVKQVGLSQSVAFYLSKISKHREYEDIFRVISEACSDKSCVNSLREDSEGEGKGYTTLLATLAYAIENIAKEAKLDNCINLSSVKFVAECMLTLKKRKLLISVESQLTPYLITIKRMFEALFST